MDWGQLAGGLWGGAKNMFQPSQDSPYSGVFSDPRTYISGAGSIMGMISNYQKQQAQQEAMKRYIKASQQPVTPQYQPMSDMESAARNRAIKADLVSRGIPLDSSYATNLTAEGMAGHETDRWKFAMQQANSQRDQMLRALGAKAGQQYAPSSTGAFGDYLSTLNMENQQKKTRQQMASIFGQQHPQQTGQAEMSNIDPRNLQIGAMGQQMGSDPGAYGDYQGDF